MNGILVELEGILFDLFGYATAYTYNLANLPYAVDSETGEFV